MEVLPKVRHTGTAVGILAGFAASGLFMIGLKWQVRQFDKKEKQKGKLPVGLAAAADTLIDGIIIGTGFSAAQELGILLAIALSIELLFLTLSVGSEFHKSKEQSRWKGIIIITGIALLIMVGAIGALLFLRDAAQT